MTTTSELAARAAINPHRAVTVALRPDGPGRAVLACRCGTVIDADQMHWRPTLLGADQPGAVRRVVCLSCAA